MRRVNSSTNSAAQLFEIRVALSEFPSITCKYSNCLRFVLPTVAPQRFRRQAGKTVRFIQEDNVAVVPLCRKCADRFGREITIANVNMQGSVI